MIKQAITEIERTYYEHLTSIMLKTRGVRFSAAEAENKKELHSIIVISVLSVYLVGWSIISTLHTTEFTDLDKSVLNIVSIISSISILAISLFDFAVGRSVRAEKLLQNALQIGPLAREMERELARAAPNSMKLAAIADAYETLIAKSGVNHTNADHRLWLYERTSPRNAFERFYLPLTKSIRRSFTFLYSAVFQLGLATFVIVTTLIIAYRVLFLL